MKKQWILGLFAVFVLQTSQPVLSAIKKQDLITLLKHQIKDASLLSNKELNDHYVKYFTSLPSTRDQISALTELETVVGPQKAHPMIQEYLSSLAMRSRIYFLMHVIEEQQKRWVALGMESIKTSDALALAIRDCAERRWFDLILPEYLTLKHVQKDAVFPDIIAWCVHYHCNCKSLVRPEYLEYILRIFWIGW